MPQQGLRLEFLVVVHLEPPLSAVSSDAFVVVTVGPHFVPFEMGDRYAIFLDGPHGVKRLGFVMLLVLSLSGRYSASKIACIVLITVTIFFSNI